MTSLKLSRAYSSFLPLKYGCNPHQLPAGVYMPEGRNPPFRVLNGTPGYINLLDALNAWQLVTELRSALGLPAAASFKHVSPAGAAVAHPLSPALLDVYEVAGKELSPGAVAYVRARGADPKSSFGDFAAFSDPVDESCADLLRTEVSDGVIAPGYLGKALDILKGKKGGGFVVLEADPGYRPDQEEVKEVFGVAFVQRRNDAVLAAQHLARRVTTNQDLPPAAVRDLLLAAITVKYTQSNSVGYALDGQMIGVGAGQQSRVDCTRLAGRKAEIWYLRQHPRVRSLPFRTQLKRVERTNARVRFIEGDFTPPEHDQWAAQFTGPPAPLSAQEQMDWLGQLSGVSLASDAFFPFRDNIDQAARRGVRYIVQPGGSVADAEVIRACDEYGMIMAFSGLRLFHH
jgi:phosphoribosylaminoimidazolecarboxamide formyltransferase/IMP cyclohydrolase